MSNPRVNVPNRDPGLHPNRAPGRSLAEELGPVVDEVRQIATDLGMRPYRVFSVTVRWSGGTSGRGRAEVVSEVELLPTPRVIALDAMKARAMAAGVVIRGDIRMREVSPRYTEDEVRGLFCADKQRPELDVFIEVRHDERDGKTDRRRFVVEVVPYRDLKRFEWVAVLSSQQGDRDRDGQVAEDVQSPAQVQMHRMKDGRRT